jgi:hypothetical protein
MAKKELTPQAKRLKDFIDKTGYSANSFAKECNIPSTRSVTKITTDGCVPTTKFLNRVKERFPMLNTDYIVLGVGNMMLNEELNLHFQGTDEDIRQSIYDELDKEEAEDNRPFTSMDGQMLWDRVDALEKRLSIIERRLSKLV